MIKKMGSSIYARNGSVRKPDQPAGLRRNKPANPITISSTPNVQTMAAPEGRSHWKEKKQPGDPAEQRDDPADEQTVAKRSREIDPADRGHDQITENKQHAGDANEAGHDQTEKRVKQKIPPAHAQAVLVGAVAIEGDEEKRLAQGEMNDADEEKKPETFPDVESD